MRQGIVWVLHGEITTNQPHVNTDCGPMEDEVQEDAKLSRKATGLIGRVCLAELRSQSHILFGQRI
jgi:hypothetical protein